MYEKLDLLYYMTCNWIREKLDLFHDIWYLKYLFLLHIWNIYWFIEIYGIWMHAQHTKSNKLHIWEASPVPRSCRWRSPPVREGEDKKVAEEGLDLDRQTKIVFKERQRVREARMHTSRTRAHTYTHTHTRTHAHTHTQGKTWTQWMTSSTNTRCVTSADPVSAQTTIKMHLPSIYKLPSIYTNYHQYTFTSADPVSAQTTIKIYIVTFFIRQGHGRILIRQGRETCER